jgi:hypothetical protein
MSPSVIVVDYGLIGSGYWSGAQGIMQATGHMALARRSIPGALKPRPLLARIAVVQINVFRMRSKYDNGYASAGGLPPPRRKSAIDHLVKISCERRPGLMFRSVVVNDGGADRNAQCLTSINAGFSSRP